MLKIAVVGLGYVGINLAMAFDKIEEVIGYDVNVDRVEQLKSHYDRYNSVSLKQLKESKIFFSSDETSLKEANFYIIAVPTPVGLFHKPDLTYLESACHSIAKFLKKGDVVVNESTVYPGATEEVGIPILEKESGLKSGRDFFVGYSPERINPGDEKHTITEIKKIISGQNEEALEKVRVVYSKLTQGGLHLTSSIKVAEAIKVFENTQRDVNVALFNEFAQLATILNINIYEVIDGLKTKWNFLDFSPGFVGGHCISVDPYYLTFRARDMGMVLRLIETAREVNNNLGFLIEHILAKLVSKNHILEEASIGVFGLTYKEDIPDCRNSLSIDLVKALSARGFKVYANDPIISKADSGKLKISITDFDELPQLSAIIITKADSVYREWGFSKIAEKLRENGCFFDIPGLFRNEPIPRQDIYYEAY